MTEVSLKIANDGEFLISENFDRLLDRFYREFHCLIEAETALKKIHSWTEIGLMAGNAPTWGYVPPVGKEATRVMPKVVVVQNDQMITIKSTDTEYGEKYKTHYERRGESSNFFSFTRVMEQLYKVGSNFWDYDKVFYYDSNGDNGSINELIDLIGSSKDEFNKWWESASYIGDMSGLVFFPIVWAGTSREPRIVGTIFLGLKGINDSVVEQILGIATRTRILLNALTSSVFFGDIALYSQSIVASRIASFLKETHERGGWFCLKNCGYCDVGASCLCHDDKNKIQQEILGAQFFGDKTFTLGNYKGMFEIGNIKDVKDSITKKLLLHNNKRLTLPICMIQEVLSYFIARNVEIKVPDGFGNDCQDCNNCLKNVALPIQPGFLFLASLADALNDLGALNDQLDRIKIGVEVSSLSSSQVFVYGFSFALPMQEKDDIHKLWLALNGSAKAGDTTRRLRDLIHVRFSEQKYASLGADVRLLMEGFNIPVATLLMSEHVKKSALIKLLWLGQPPMSGV